MSFLFLNLSREAVNINFIVIHLIRTELKSEHKVSIVDPLLLRSGRLVQKKIAPIVLSCKVNGE